MSKISFIGNRADIPMIKIKYLANGERFVAPNDKGEIKEVWVKTGNYKTDSESYLCISWSYGLSQWFWDSVEVYPCKVVNVTAEGELVVEVRKEA